MKGRKSGWLWLLKCQVGSKTPTNFDKKRHCWTFVSENEHGKDEKLQRVSKTRSSWLKCVLPGDETVYRTAKWLVFGGTESV